MKTQARALDPLTPYWKSSGGNASDVATAYRMFPRSTSSVLEARVAYAAAPRSKPAVTTPLGVRHLGELHATLLVNRPELAAILRVAPSTLSAWLNGSRPSAPKAARVRQILHLLAQVGASPGSPLFPRFVRRVVEPGRRSLLDLLCEDPISVDVVAKVIRRVKEMGDEIDRRREEREDRQRRAGFAEPTPDERKSNLAMNVTLLTWPRD